MAFSDVVSPESDNNANIVCRLKATVNQA